MNEEEKMRWLDMCQILQEFRNIATRLAEEVPDSDKKIAIFDEIADTNRHIEKFASQFVAS